MTANSTSPFVRWLVVSVLGAATAGMIAVSLRANYLFGYGFGQTPEKAHIFGWANVAADIWKVSGLIIITSLWRAKQRRFAFSLMPIWALCLLWGLIGAIGIYAHDRSALIGGRQATAATYADVERELQDIDVRHRALTQRSVGQIDSAIAAILARPVLAGERMRGTVGKISASCSKDDRGTTEACAEVAGLRAERALALEAAELQQRKRLLQGQIIRLRESGGSLPVDPLAELFAWLSRGQLSVRDIGFGFPLFFAVLIEVVSAFGPAGIVAYAEVTRPDTKADIMSRPVAAGRDLTRHVEAHAASEHAREEGRVAHYMADRTEPTKSPAALGLDQLFADYQVWCLGKQLHALTLTEFADEFDQVRESPQLAGKIKKFGTRDFGIGFLASKALSQPVSE